MDLLQKQHFICFFDPCVFTTHSCRNRPQSGRFPSCSPLIRTDVIEGASHGGQNHRRHEVMGVGKLVLQIDAQSICFGTTIHTQTVTII